ncbi:MAG: glycosyltransferase [Lachnospiraceae bacterium]|nr:glycosyltransferase [Lachnospiraceae bacterium]
MDYTALYHDAMVQFENENYDRAVEELIELYNSGIECEAIWKFLYECFIMPNEEEFRKNYEGVQDGFSSCRYEELAVDFIPVSDDKYYLFLKPQQQFAGYIDLSEYVNEERELSFEGCFIADSWDLREMIPILDTKQWRNVYVVVEEVEEYFASFLKLPGVVQRFLNNAIVVNSWQLLVNYFKGNPGEYLPSQIASKNLRDYQGTLSEIHQSRLKEKHREVKPYISICMPSYNRGKAALENIKHLLELHYDSEIEIVISDNGSTKETAEYKEIAEIKDSRLTYYRMEENAGYGRNLSKVYELARGEYVLFCSDEDGMILEQFPKLLDFLYKKKFAMIHTSGIGNNFPGYQDSIHVAGSMEALNVGINMNFVTGVLVNKTLLEEHNGLERINDFMDNYYVELYTHSILSLIASFYGPVGELSLKLWKEDEFAGEEEKEIQEQPRLLNYMKAESRIKQQNSLMEFLVQMPEVNNEMFVDILLARITKTYFLLSLAYYYYYEAASKERTLFEGFLTLHQNNVEQIEHYKAKYDEEIFNILKQQEIECFWKEVQQNPSWISGDKLQKHKASILNGVLNYYAMTHKDPETVDYEKVKADIDQLCETGGK